MLHPKLQQRSCDFVRKQSNSKTDPVQDMGQDQSTWWTICLADPSVGGRDRKTRGNPNFAGACQQGFGGTLQTLTKRGSCPIQRCHTPTLGIVQHDLFGICPLGHRVYQG